ncbi:hypothetical protein FOZ63_025428 [Perkinsus olseni]|uniref:Uncharacterized protein n=1 Tax=Perkinsus olseni TaxID=32597 RepID=A0A7J6QA40_PEROL|nr:hypothetical protein FOZ62_030652 [Perkinsus olseni]KAF4746399.1 hypothetical protein FOZ63_025428 [Perkinsus olseni]
MYVTSVNLTAGTYAAVNGECGRLSPDLPDVTKLEVKVVDGEEGQLVSLSAIVNGTFISSGHEWPVVWYGKSFLNLSRLGHIPVYESPDCFRFPTKCVGPDFARLLYLQSNKPPGGDPCVIFCIKGSQLLVGLGAVRVSGKWQASTYGFRTILGASTSSGSDDTQWRTVPPPSPKRKERPPEFVADRPSKGTKKKKRENVPSTGTYLAAPGSDQNSQPSTVDSEASFLPSFVVVPSPHGTVGRVLVALTSSTLPDGEYVVVNTRLDLLRSVVVEIETVPPTDYRWVKLSFEVNGPPVSLETIALSFDGCLELDFSDELNSLALLLLQSALEVREIVPESFRLLREPGDGWSLLFHVHPDPSGTVVEIRAALLVSAADAGQ